VSVTPTERTVLGVFTSAIQLMVPGLQVINAGDPEATAPRPTVESGVDSYAAIEISSDSSSWATAGENTTNTVSGDKVEQVRGLPVDGVLAIEIYGPEAMDKAKALRMSHGRADVLRLLETAGDYALDSPSDITRDPVLRSATREPGAAMTFVAKWVELETYDTEGVDTITPVVSVT
jgi:hypothetical protein